MTTIEAGPKEPDILSQEPPKEPDADKPKKRLEQKEKQRVDDAGEAEARAYAEKYFRDVSMEPGAKERFKDKKTFLKKQRETDKMAEVLGDEAAEKHKIAKVNKKRDAGSVFNEPAVLKNIIAGIEKPSKINEAAEALEKLANKETTEKKIEKNVAALHEMREARERTEKPKTAETEKTEPEKKELSPETKILFQEELLCSIAGFIDEVKYRLDSPDIPVKDKSRAEVKYSKARTAYRELNGRDLNSDVKERAMTEAEREGHQIRTRKEYFSPENTSRIKEKERHEMWATGIKAAWERLLKREKDRWDRKASKDETTQRKTDGGERQFARQLEADRKELAKKGFTFTRDAYFSFFEQGYDPRTIKQTGMLFWKKIEMKKAGARKPETFKLDDFEVKNKETQDKFDRELSKRTSEKMQTTCTEGRSRWMKRKVKAVGDIALENTKEYQADEVNKNATPNLMEQAVRPEEVMPTGLETEDAVDKFEKEAEEEFERKDTALRQITDKISRQLGLSDRQKEYLGIFVADGAESQKKFPVSRDVLRRLREKRLEINRRRQFKKSAADRARAIIFRKDIFREIAAL